MTRVILIRHGETDWNRQKRYYGSTDIDLNKTGKLQAQRLSERLRKETIDKVYSSDMKRTRNFANLALKDMVVGEIPGFREINFGDFEGLTHEELVDKHAVIYKKWLNNPRGTLIPRGERLDSFAKRVKESLSGILSLHKKGTVVVFSHAGPLRVILSELLKVDLKDAWQIKQDSGNINIIEFEKTKSKIILQNDTAYLNSEQSYG